MGENLGTLIRTIYDFAFVTYADLPRGAIKNNSMRRLAATTLMEILPPHIAERVNKKMEAPGQQPRLPLPGGARVILRLGRGALTRAYADRRTHEISTQTQMQAE